MANGRVTLSRRIDEVKAQQKEIADEVHKVYLLLMGDPDHPEQPGFIERMRNVESWQKNEKWALLVFGGLFLTDLGYTILEVWKK